MAGFVVAAALAFFFLVLLVETGDFTVAVLGSSLAWLLLGTVRAAERLMDRYGLFGLVFVLLGISWLFGSENDDFDGRATGASANGAASGSDAATTKSMSLVARGSSWQELASDPPRKYSMPARSKARAATSAAERTSGGSAAGSGHGPSVRSASSRP